MIFRLIPSHDAPRRHLDEFHALLQTSYYSYGNIVRDNQNAFGLYEASPARDFGIIMMCINNLVAFGLFVGPLFHILEKALKIHRKAFWIRVSARLPLIGVIVLFAIAFPFYGAVSVSSRLLFG